jgi:septum formation protein
LEAETPTTGSAKEVEGLGIALLFFSSIDNDDPTALVGLPLIRTCHA